MKALVTGGAGFLGGAIVRQLIERGDSVRSFSRGDYPALRETGVETFQGDLSDSEAVERAVEGCDIVFHVAAKAGVWGSYYDYYEPNVVGTQCVLEACQKHGVQRLVYTSTPSVTFTGKDQEGVDESAPIAERFLCNYPKSKATAEQLVLQDNGEGIYTVALRPHLIWGPSDTQLVPRLIERAKADKLRLVGSGQKLVDAVYIENAAHAHVLAGDRLGPEAACGGNAYYITNDEPWPMADIINGILDAAGLPHVSKSVSPSTAYWAGALLEAAYMLARKKEEPPMTRFVARQLATAHWYDISAAKRDLGYAPKVSMEQGMERLRESLS